MLCLRISDIEHNQVNKFELRFHILLNKRNYPSFIVTFTIWSEIKTLRVHLKLATLRALYICLYLNYPYFIITFLPSMIFSPLTGDVRRSPAKLNTDVLLSSSVMLLIAVSEELLAFISSSAVMKRCLQPVAV